MDTCGLCRVITGFVGFRVQSFGLAFGDVGSDK